MDLGLENRVIQKELLGAPEVVQQFGRGTWMLDVTAQGVDVSHANADLVGRGLQTLNLAQMNESHGRFFKINMMTYPMQNVAMGTDYGRQYGRASQLTLGESRWRAKRHTTRINFEQLEIMFQSGGSNSDENIESLKTDGVINQIRHAMSEKLHRDGSELIGDVPSSGNNWDDSGQLLTVTDGTLFLDKIGQEIMLRNKTTGAAPTLWPTMNGTAAPAIITSVSGNNIGLSNSLLNNGAGGALKNDAGTALTNSVMDGMGIYYGDSQGYGIFGLDAICSDTNMTAGGYDPASPATILTGENSFIERVYGGIDRYTNPFWRAHVVAANSLNGGSAVPSVEGHLRPVYNRVTKNVGGWQKGDVLLAVSGQEVVDRIALNMKADQMTNYRTALVEGYETVQFQNMFIFADPFTNAPLDLKIWEFKACYRNVLQDWTIDNSTGSEHNRETGPFGRPTGISSILMSYVGAGLVAGRCNGSARITGFDIS